MYNNKKHEWQSQSAHHWYLSHCSLARWTFKLMIRLSPKCCMSGAYWAWRRELWAVSSFVFHKPRPWSIENWRAFKLWRFQNGKRKKRLNSKPSIYSSSQNGARRARWPWRSKLSRSPFSTIMKKFGKKEKDELLTLTNYVFVASSSRFLCASCQKIIQQKITFTNIQLKFVQ